MIKIPLNIVRLKNSHYRAVISESNKIVGLLDNESYIEAGSMNDQQKKIVEENFKRG